MMYIMNIWHQYLFDCSVFLSTTNRQFKQIIILWWILNLFKDKIDNLKVKLLNFNADLKNYSVFFYCLNSIKLIVVHTWYRVNFCENPSNESMW